MTDQAQALRLMQVIEALDIDSADGRAGITSLLREIEAAEPGAMKRMSAGLRMRRLLGPSPTPQ